MQNSGDLTKVNSSRIKELAEISWLAEAISLLSGLLFTFQIWYYAHTQASNLDEGAYLLKGYYFAIGKYFPYQDYGFLTNHMPLSFLIPGWAQAIFGPGLRTGRYLTIFLSVLMLLGAWLLSRRLGGRWWAAAAVSVLTVNVLLIKVYSVMASQGLVACMLVWVLVLTLGEDRRLWQLLLGTALAAAMAMTRFNMIPVLPFLVLYIFWQHGKRPGWWSLAVGTTVFAGIHLAFWPGILRMWVYWLPLDSIPYFQAFAAPENALPFWDPATNFIDRLQSFFNTVRMHYFAVAGALASWVLWPKKNEWRQSWRFKAAVYLSVLFGTLALMHIWASLGKNYCVYCLNVYFAFFPILGIVLVIVCAPLWGQGTARARRWLPAALIYTLSVGISYSMISAWNLVVDMPVVRRIMHIEIPRVKSFRIQPGTMELWSPFANKFGWEELQIARTLQTAVFILLGVFAGWLIVKFGARLGCTLLGKSASRSAAHLAAFLLIGWVVTSVAGLAPYDRDCGWDVIASYEQGGAYLAENIPAGSQVYWRGGLSVVPLVYLPDVEIFPQQINQDYSYRLSGGPDELLRYGWWSYEVAGQWLAETDVILIEERLYDTFLVDIAEGGDFYEIPPTAPMVTCSANSAVHIYLRNE